MVSMWARPCCYNSMIRTALWLLEAVKTYGIIIIRRAERAHMECCVVKLKPSCRNAATFNIREVAIAHLLADTGHQSSRGPLDWIAAEMRAQNSTKHIAQRSHRLRALCLYF